MPSGISLSLQTFAESRPSIGVAMKRVLAVNHISARKPDQERKAAIAKDLVAKATAAWPDIQARQAESAARIKRVLAEETEFGNSVELKIAP